MTLVRPGDVSVDFGSASLDFDSGTGARRLRGEFLASFTVLGPSAAENLTLALPDSKFEILGARSVLRGQSSPSVTWNVRHDTNRGATGLDVFETNPVTTSTTTPETDDVGAGQSKLGTGESLWFVTTATAGSVDEIAVTLLCRWRSD